MDGQKLKKHVLGSKKTERIIFAATPEMKEALETIAQEKCVSLSALLTSRGYSHTSPPRSKRLSRPIWRMSNDRNLTCVGDDRELPPWRHAGYKHQPI